MIEAPKEGIKIWRKPCFCYTALLTNEGSNYNKILSNRLVDSYRKSPSIYNSILGLAFSKMLGKSSKHILANGGEQMVVYEGTMVKNHLKQFRVTYLPHDASMGRTVDFTDP